VTALVIVNKGIISSLMVVVVMCYFTQSIVITAGCKNIFHFRT